MSFFLHLVFLQIGSLSRASSMNELPNLPGVRRDISKLNPKLYREFQASRQASTGQLDGVSRAQTPAVEPENSLTSYFENPSRFELFKESLNFFPNEGSAYNDINGRYSLRSQQQDRLQKSRSLPYCSLDSAPSYVLNDTRVCCYMAYYEEDAPENLLETRRARKVEIRVYLADNTIEICEPTVKNSGLSQGKMLRRHQVRKPTVDGRISTPGPLESGVIKAPEIYTLDDFNAGSEVNIYNRLYTITDVDEPTRRYLQGIGKPFGQPKPTSTLYWNPELRPGNLRPKKMAHKTLKNLGFYEYERKCLRFFGVWDSREILFGDETRVRIHYSLADNKIEVLPINERNSGKDKQSRLLKKTVIMKKPGAADDLDFPASYSRLTTASGIISRPNTQGGSTFQGNRSASAQELTRPAPLPDHTTRPYHWKDLFIGERIAVASLFILITDADEFTREFYKSKGMTLGPKIEMPVPTFPKLETYIPPYNPLYGSEEDSLATCKGSLAGSGPVMKDGAKAKLFAGMIMKFLCTLENPTPADETRKFTLQVLLEDDTVQISEPQQRNSGHKGGTFLARGKIQMETVDKTGKVIDKRPFLPQDVVVGTTCKIRSHKFVVHDADEFTYKFMEENPKQFPYSDVKAITIKLKRNLDKIKSLILSLPALENKQVKYRDMAKVFNKAGCTLVKQEVVSLMRHLDPRRSGDLKYTQVLKYLMT